MQISFSEDFKLPGARRTGASVFGLDEVRGMMKAAIERYDWAQADIKADDHELSAVATDVMLAHAAYVQLQGMAAATPAC